MRSRLSDLGSLTHGESCEWNANSGTGSHGLRLLQRSACHLLRSHKALVDVVDTEPPPLLGLLGVTEAYAAGRLFVLSRVSSSSGVNGGVGFKGEAALS